MASSLRLLDDLHATPTHERLNLFDEGDVGSDSEVAVALWMPAMGHGSSPVTVGPQGGGVYSVSKAYFIMPGTWDVRVQIKKNHQLFEQAVVSVSL